MRLTLLLCLLLLTVFWISTFGMYFARMDLSPQSVQDYYLGSEAQFKMPRTYQSMLEISHMHLPMIALVVLLVSHLLIFAPFSSRIKVTIILSAFLSGLVNEGSGWLVRFVHPEFAILKVISFLIFQASLGFLLFGLILFLICRPAKKQNRLRKQADSDEPTGTPAFNISASD